MYKTNLMPTLQEKSASGAVATFNTALAMPLASCNIAVNAWQEGSGDPSPSNVRAIHGFSEVNTTVGSGNLYNGTFGGYNELSLKAGKQLVFQGDMSDNVYLTLRVYDENKTFLQSTTTLTGTGTRYGVITLNSDISYYRVERSSQSGVYNNIMLSFGTTVKPYTPYVTPTIYLIQLGQEVYGAEVDVVNGVAHVTHNLVDLGDINYAYGVATNWAYFAADIPQIKPAQPLKSDIFKFKGYSVLSLNENYTISGSGSLNRFYIRDDDYTEPADFKAAVTGHYLLFELVNPFDIQLTPTQIETNIGNNTIFADTGNIDLTYKDLDIAKRGSFREVFKLPS